LLPGEKTLMQRAGKGIKNVRVKEGEREREEERNKEKKMKAKESSLFCFLGFASFTFCLDVIFQINEPGLVIVHFEFSCAG
jgi:hypothetical protein